jgi:hypothetical protein
MRCWFSGSTETTRLNRSAEEETQRKRLTVEIEGGEVGVFVGAGRLVSVAEDVGELTSVGDSSSV